MEPEMIIQLLEKIDGKEYTMAIRHLSHNNKKLRIPGFSVMEKAPIRLVANTARTNKFFRKALYKSISTVILAGIKVDLTKNTEELKKEIPQAQWLGIAAYLLMVNEEKYATDAVTIISECGNAGEARDNEQLLQNESEPKQDKKEERFREKYLKAKNENAELVAELERCKAKLLEDAAEIEKLKEIQNDLESQCALYLEKINDLSNNNSRLLQELEEMTEQTGKVQTALDSQVNVRVFAPYCKDLLEKYGDTIPIVFDGSIAMGAARAVEQYDEIWVFPDVVPFGTYRVLQKWKKSADEKVFIFHTAVDLVAHAEKVLQADGRRN